MYKISCKYVFETRPMAMIVALVFRKIAISVLYNSM